MRFDLPSDINGNLPNLELIFQSAPVQRIQSRQLFLSCCHDQFSANLVTDPMLITKLADPTIPFASEPGLGAAWFVINARMNNAAVPSALVQRQFLLFFQNHDC